MMKGSRNRTEILVGAGLLVFSVSLGLFFLSIYQSSQQQAAAQEKTAAVVLTFVPPTATPEMVELWSAYEQARAAAQAKAADVQLVSASAQWQAAGEKTLLAGSENWAFTFYSPANGQMTDVIVSAEKAWVVNQSQAGNAPSVLVEGAWSVGPRDILLIFLAHGAREFLDTYPQATVELHLARHKDGYPAWNAVALDSQAKDSFAVLVNADTMQTLSKAP
jgi:hypothetical protein